jgi:hypothetical protein
MIEVGVAFGASAIDHSDRPFFLSGHIPILRPTLLTFLKTAFELRFSGAANPRPGLTADRGNSRSRRLQLPFSSNA